MNLTRKEKRNIHRGIIGIESAIVLIAFVIVAAALAFVVLNMGFSTTQKAKTAVVASLEEASSAIEIAGKVTGIGDVNGGYLNTTTIPIKIAAGGGSVNLSNETASIRYISNLIEFDDIFTGTLHVGTYPNASEAFQAATAQNLISSNPVNDTAPAKTTAIVYWSVNRNNNFILDAGEHATVAIAYKQEERPQVLENIRAEVLLPTGSPLTIERLVPNITHFVMDLG